MNRALLIAGGVDRKRNHRRYVNDILAFSTMLRKTRGILDDEIRILVGPGGAFDVVGDGRLSPVSAAGRPEVDAALRWLAEAREGDLVLLVVSNHGNRSGFCLWGAGNVVTPHDLETALRLSRGTKLLVFGQCNAGIFGAMKLDRSVVCCACGPDQSSWALVPAAGAEPVYDDFLYRFVGALAGCYPDGRPLAASPLLSPRPTIGEVFRFARDQDRSRETPLMFDPEGLADRLRL